MHERALRSRRSPSVTRCHPGHQRLHLAGGQTSAPPRRPRRRSPPPADPVRAEFLPAARRSNASWWCATRSATEPPHEGAALHPDRGDGGRRRRRAFRHLGRLGLAWSATSISASCRTCCPRWRRRSSTSARAQRRALRRRGELGGRRSNGRANRKIEQALKPGDYVVVQVSKDPVGPQGRPPDHPGLAGRPLPGLRARRIVDRDQPQAARHRTSAPQGDPARGGAADAGVIIRTASEGRQGRRHPGRRQPPAGALDQDRRGGRDGQARPRRRRPALYEEPDVLVKVIRDLFNEDFPG